MYSISKIDRCHCSQSIICIKCGGDWVYVNDAGIRICQECNKCFTWRDEPAGQELLKWANKQKG